MRALYRMIRLLLSLHWRSRLLSLVNRMCLVVNLLVAVCPHIAFRKGPGVRHAWNHYQQQHEMTEDRSATSKEAAHIPLPGLRTAKPSLGSGMQEANRQKASRDIGASAVRPSEINARD